MRPENNEAKTKTEARQSAAENEAEAEDKEFLWGGQKPWGRGQTLKYKLKLCTVKIAFLIWENKCNNTWDIKSQYQ